MTIVAESSSLPPSTWLDRLRMVPIIFPDTLSKDEKNCNAAAAADQDTGTAGSESTAADEQPRHHLELEFNIVSLNMLAETYVSPRSHPGLPDSYANVAFDKGKRRKLLVDTLERFCSPRTHNNEGGTGSIADKKWDIIALQELDLVGPDDPILPAFQRWGYQVIRTPNDQRKDCCAIAFDKSKFTLIEYEVVKFDDLATLHHSDPYSKKYRDSAIDSGESNIYSSNVKSKKSSNTAPPELTGLVRSFLRRNYAIMAHLKSIDDNTQSFIVASVHLYWNPGFEYVKLCQAKYLLDRVAEFASIKTINGDDGTKPPTKESNVMLLPTIICGDMNSKPGSTVHSLFVKPYVDARTVAPWNYFWDPDEEIMYTEEENSAKGKDELDGQDLVVAATSNLMNERDLREKDGLNGYTMNGFSADFAMYCGLAVDDKDCTLSGTSESTRQNDQSDGYDEINESYDGLRSSLLSWNGLHKRTANTSISCGSTNSTFPTDTPLEMNDATNNDDDGLRASLAWGKLHQRTSPQDYQHSLPPLKVKYMLDYTLNRFSRWLRILGIDAALETLEEEKERTSGGEIALFEHCKREQRTLLTTSYKLLLRKDCPPGAYLLDPKSTSDLEKALPRLLRTHGVELSPRKFLTVCVVCNGDIQRVFTDDEKRLIFMEHGAPDLVESKENLEVFRCNGCRQGYWWDDRPSSSASRVFSQATKLLRICLRGGVGLKDEAVNNETVRRHMMGAFDFVDVPKERQSKEYLENDFIDLSVISWLREEKLRSSFNLKSAYAIGNTARESLPFTNVTNEFVGCLDYIFFQQPGFDLIGTLDVPKSFRDLNSSGNHRGHLIPSDIWPSDHIAVGSRLRLKQINITKEKSDTVDRASSSSGDEGNGTDHGKSQVHAPRCGCGCVPAILSLFEMAELRKKAREKKAAEDASLGPNKTNTRS